MIGILDYGLGNIMAFYNFFKMNNINSKIISKNIDLDSVEKIILPGVGSFDNAIKMFNQSGLRETTEKLVIDKKIPILGICVGMQILGNISEEGTEKGLGWIEGEIIKMVFNDIELPLPHLGWNKITSLNNSDILAGISNSYFYFLHSYVFIEKNSSNKLATFNYQKDHTCVIGSENIYGVQFHPEKSHEAGSRLLINFSKI